MQIIKKKSSQHDSHYLCTLPVDMMVGNSWMDGEQYAAFQLFHNDLFALMFGGSVLTIQMDTKIISILFLF